FGNSSAWNVDLSCVVGVDREVDFIQRLLVWILDHLLRAHHHVARLGIDIDCVLHVTDARHKLMIVLLVGFLILSLSPLQCLWTDYVIYNFSVVPDPCSRRRERHCSQHRSKRPPAMIAQACIAPSS